MQENLVGGRAFDFDGTGGGGEERGGWVVWSVCTNFFPQTFGDIIFFLTLTTGRCKIFFSSIISDEKYFSSVQKFFPRGISLQELFFP